MGKCIDINNLKYALDIFMNQARDEFQTIVNVSGYDDAEVEAMVNETLGISQNS